MDFYHPGRDVSLVAHGDDFTFCGVEEELVWIRDLLASWLEINVRANLGGEHCPFNSHRCQSLPNRLNTTSIVPNTALGQRVLSSFAGIVVALTIKLTIHVVIGN